MSNLKKNEQLLVRLNPLESNYQQHLSMLQLQILKLKLKEEKLKDKTVFQSLKDKVATH
jgi:hypothetical protein